MAEEPERPTKTKRNKIASLIADLSEAELDFLIRTIKGIKTMNHTDVVFCDESDEDEEEGADI